MKKASILFSLLGLFLIIAVRILPSSIFSTLTPQVVCSNHNHKLLCVHCFNSSDKFINNRPILLNLTQSALIATIKECIDYSCHDLFQIAHIEHDQLRIGLNPQINQYLNFLDARIQWSQNVQRLINTGKSWAVFSYSENDHNIKLNYQNKQVQIIKQYIKSILFGCGIYLICIKKLGQSNIEIYLYLVTFIMTNFVEHYQVKLSQLFNSLEAIAAIYYFLRIVDVEIYQKIILLIMSVYSHYSYLNYSKYQKFYYLILIEIILIAYLFNKNRIDWNTGKSYSGLALISTSIFRIIVISLQLEWVLAIQNIFTWSFIMIVMIESQEKKGQAINEREDHQYIFED